MPRPASCEPGDDVAKLAWWRQPLWLDIENPRLSLDVDGTALWGGPTPALVDGGAGDGTGASDGTGNGGDGAIPEPPEVGQWWWSMEDEVWYPMDPSPATP